MVPCKGRIPLFLLLVASSVTFVRGEEVEYCPFYNNRGTSEQPFLKNCTWYKANACCMQVEIDYGFASVKPPQGASDACLKQLNYLMCYICDPTQSTFYKNEYLTVCLEFCNNFYDACKDAILKGSVISELYSNGYEFCKSRQFLVHTRNETGKCFYYDGSSDTSGSVSLTVRHAVILYMLLVCLYSQLCA